MGFIKPAGKNTWTQRTHKMHGSTALWGLHKSQGKLMRWAEKPSGSKRPGGGKPGKK